MAVATASWFLHKTEKSTCCNSFPGGLGNEPVARRCSFQLCKKVGVTAEHCRLPPVVGRAGRRQDF
ncbi:hypothetical protein DPK28_25685, partial [Salmonella enterica subsp. enterica serovar Newport]|nr:hypothetical protein [Salmonella enterica subsp. enterica serovar Newport]